MKSRKHGSYANEGVHNQTEKTEINGPKNNYQDPVLFLKALTDIAPFIVYVYDLKKCCNLYANGGIKKILGFSTNEIKAMGDKLFERLVHPEDLNKVINFQKKVQKAENNNILKIEYRAKDKQGKWHFLQSFECTFKRNDQGEAEQKVGVAIDITEQKNIEMQLRESENRLRSLINSTPDIICFKGGEGRWLEANDADLELFALTETDYRGKTDKELAEFAHPAYSESFLTCAATDEKAWQNKEISRGEEAIVKPDGQKKIYDVIKVPVFEKNDQRKGLVVLGRDITERKLAEEQRKKAEEEIHRMQRIEELGTVAGGIAHDFNNLLAAIFGNLELAKMKLPEANPAYRYLMNAHKAIQNARELTGQLLTFAKGGSPVFGIVETAKLVREIVEFNLHGSNVAQDIQIEDNLWYIKADKAQISQVITNLTVNGRQAMPEGGTLHIYAENIPNMNAEGFSKLAGEYVKIKIQDEGQGMTSEILKHIFTPYYTTKVKGHGLGLAVVHSIVKQHNGRVLVDSVANKGTCFTIYLPAIRGIETEDKAGFLHTGAAHFHTSSLRILLMDDEEMLRSLGKEMMRCMGHAVDTTSDGQSALEKYKNSYEKGSPYDLVILDLTVPGGKGGKETVKELLKINPEAKVIVSSGYAEDPIIANYENYGFKGKLTKPFTMNELKEQLTRLTRKDKKV
jgi:PAS domain S-box-containing protein